MSKLTIPVAVALPVVAVGAAIAKDLMGGVAGQEQAIGKITGWSKYDGWKWSRMAPTYVPILAGMAVSYGATMFGLNRKLARIKGNPIRV